MIKKIFLLSGTLALSAATMAQTKKTVNDNLYNGFLSPSNAAKPRVWWHWMNGNITKEGIRKDLEWMHRSGIGGFQNFDAGMATPQVVTKRLTYMTPEWKDAFRFTTRLADSLKLEMAIAGSPGWSESGGPWVPAKNGMKKLVWSEVQVTGGQPFNGTIPKPPAITGVFQNLPYEEALGANPDVKSPPQFYEDVALLAYRLPVTQVSLSTLNPKITSSGGSFNLTQLTDGDLATTALLPRVESGDAWIQFEFPQPQTIKAVTVVGGGDKGPFGRYGEKAEDRSLQVSDDGQTFRHISFIPAGGMVEQTITIPATTGKYFRVTFKNPPPSMNLAAWMGGGGGTPKPSPGTNIAEVVLYPYSVIDRFEEKAGYAAYASGKITGYADNLAAIPVTDVIDLTGKLDGNGTLNWTIPAGNWKIMRFGYSLTGKQNHPASPEATGLEVDKLDAEAVKAYFENYLDQYKDASGGLMGTRGLQYIITDSYEAGQENWTPKMFQEFQKRRGYSLLPWMPVISGQIVKSTEESEKFLWDFRKTIAELVAENHYDQLTNILAKYGMKRYTESHESGRAYIVDGMDVKRTAAVPMSAMWTPRSLSPNQTGYMADIRESASVAHIYGQNLVAAESLTAFGIGGNAWSYSPETLKPTADLELASGLNRFVIHTSVHQPVDDKIPGLGLGPFGQWFNRHETWANQAKVWTDYLARSSYLLQQGKFVADVVYYYGEDNNITSLYSRKLPDIPAGYNYDFINSHALLNLLTVKNGQLVTPSGMSYRVLALDSNSRQMPLNVLIKLRDLVRAGAVIVGPKPTVSPSLKDNLADFNAIVQELWGGNYSGKVYTGQSIKQVLAELKIVPDFEYTKPNSTTSLLYVHRKLSDGEVYWVNNRSDQPQDLEAMFRVKGKEAEIWHPETGEKEKASYTTSDGRTKLSLQLTSNDAVFVVFRANSNKTSWTGSKHLENEIMTVAGSWDVNFQQNRVAPATANFDRLVSYTEKSDPGIKYFSGTATYTKTITAGDDWFGKGAKIWLDLGEVKNLAEVTVNGKSLGIVWKKPFRVDATGVLKKGENKVEIKVTNLWVNRLIGDAQPGVTNKITYTSMPFYTADSPLLPSGLLGPVKIISLTDN